MKKALSLLLCLVALSAYASVDNLLPKPRQIELTGSSFALGGEVRLTDETSCYMLQEFLAMYGYTVNNNAARTISVEQVAAISDTKDYTLAGFENEAYRLQVGADAITISVVNPIGVYRAAATLMQLAEGESAIAGVDIIDWPAFKLRGWMHDVGRSFVSVERLKKEIELYSRFKVNTFHWHLTENQAWRFEVKAYPQLTNAAYATRFAGQFYTQEECKEVMQWATKHGITIIPEIDMPGHSSCFKSAMGHSMQTDEGVAELKTILDEVCSVFSDCPVIHIGGDEETITYNNFLQIMMQKVRDNGKKVMTWNPISGVNVANLKPDIAQCWSTAGKPSANWGIAAVDCRYNYSNHFDVFADLAGIYMSNILYVQEGNEEVAGTISCPWNDHKLATELDIIRQNNTWANTIASGSRAWTGGGEQYIEAGGTNLPNSGPIYEDFVDWEARFLHWRAAWLPKGEVPYVKQTNIKWRVSTPVAIGTEANLEDSRIMTGGGIYLRHTWGATVPSIFDSYSTGNYCYAWTNVYSETEQTVGALIEFQNFGRSENDAAPALGTWDGKGSKIYLNDEEIAPPTWINPGTSVGKENNMGNENWVARDPIQLTLKEGWNEIKVYLPYTNSSNYVRLNKWMWTCVLTDPTGENALEGIRYSPDKMASEENEAFGVWLDEVYNDVAGRVSDEVGCYKLRSEQTLNLLGIIKYYQELTKGDAAIEDRYITAYKAQVQELYDTWLANYTTYGINTPKAGKYYTLKDKRSSRYASASSNLVSGVTSPTEEAAWRFSVRADGSFDIINYDGTYLSPTAAYNNQLTTSAEQPSAGWEIKQSEAAGYVIIVSGSSQMNQTGAGLNYKVYNWGSGTNTNDEGCQYAIAEFAGIVVTDILTSTEAEEHWYNFYDNRVSYYPTNMGVGQDMYGQQTKTDAAAWKFVERSDGTLDIISHEGGYISPASATNKPLTVVAEQPSAGWTLTNTSGNYFIIASGSVQLHQTNGGLQYQIYNWGGGTKTSTGCLYTFVEATFATASEPIPVVTPDPVEVPDAPTAISTPSQALKPTTIYSISGRRVGAMRGHGLYIVDGKKVKL